MSITRRTITAAVAALALGGSMVASTPPADAHNYTKSGTASAKEARKLFKETFKQRCLTVHEARHIVHGSGELNDNRARNPGPDLRGDQEEPHRLHRTHH